MLVLHGDVAQLGERGDSCRGQRFKPSHLHHSRIEQAGSAMALPVSSFVKNALLSLPWRLLEIY